MSRSDRHHVRANIFQRNYLPVNEELVAIIHHEVACDNSDFFSERSSTSTTTVVVDRPRVNNCDLRPISIIPNFSSRNNGNIECLQDNVIRYYRSDYVDEPPSVIRYYKNDYCSRDIIQRPAVIKYYKSDYVHPNYFEIDLKKKRKPNIKMASPESSKIKQDSSASKSTLQSLVKKYSKLFVRKSRRSKT